MRPEMPSGPEGMDFGGNFHQVHPEINQVPSFNQQKSEIVPDLGGVDRLKMMAKSAAKSERIIDTKGFSENSILFQQERTKYILDIIKNDPSTAAEKIQKSWEEYDEIVEALASEQKTAVEKQQVYKDFAGIKRSIIGSLGLIKFLGKKGYEVEFPEPKEDRFGKCDLVFKMKDQNGEYNLAVQLKSFMAGSIKKNEDNEWDWEKRLQSAISINKFTLSDKNKADFEKLRIFCEKLHKETGEYYFPVFVNMPVDMERLKAKKGESKAEKLIDEGGDFQKENMKKGLDTVWKQREQNLTNWSKGVY